MNKAVITLLSLLVITAVYSQESRLQFKSYVNHTILKHSASDEILPEVFDLISNRESGDFGYGFMIQEEVILSDKSKLAIGLGLESTSYKIGEEVFEDINGDVLRYIGYSRLYRNGVLTFGFSSNISPKISLLARVSNKVNIGQKHIKYTRFPDGSNESSNIDEAYAFKFRKYNLDVGGGFGFSFFKGKKVPIYVNVLFKKDILKFYREDPLNRRMSYVEFECVFDIQSLVK